MGRSWLEPIKWIKERTHSLEVSWNGHGPVNAWARSRLTWSPSREYDGRGVDCKIESSRATPRGRGAKKETASGGGEEKEEGRGGEEAQGNGRGSIPGTQAQIHETQGHGWKSSCLRRYWKLKTSVQFLERPFDAHIDWCYWLRVENFRLLTSCYWNFDYHSQNL